MKRLILLLFSAMAYAQTFTVSGHVVNPNTGVPTGMTITFSLINTGTQQCKVSGTGLIVPNNQVFTPDGTGTISGTLYRNDFIVCGGSSNTQWSYQILGPGVTMPKCPLAAVTTTTLNVDSAACTNTVPVVVPPVGDTTYCRLDGSNCGFTGNVTFNSHNISGINNATITGALTAPTFDNILYVGAVGALYPATLAGIQAALTQCSTNNGGVVHLVDNSLASWPTLTSASTPVLTVPQNCRLEIGNMSNGGGGAGLIIQPPTSGTCIQLNGPGASLWGNTPTAAASGQNGSVITCQASGANALNIAANCTDCAVEYVNLKGASSAGNTITIQDNQRELYFEKVLIGPGTGGGECVQYVPGVNGFNFITFNQVRCDGYSGSGFDFKFPSVGTGTNLLFMNTYTNCLPNSGCVGYDMNSVSAQFYSSGADNGAIGYKLNNRSGVVASYILQGSESQSNTTAAVQVNGPVQVTSHAFISSLDAIQYDIESAGADTFIFGTTTTGTTGANSVKYAAAATGNHFLFDNRFDKPILNSSGIIINEFNGTYTILPNQIGIGITNGSAPTFTFEGNNGGVGGTNCLALDRSGTNKLRLCNEGSASQVITGGAQDDTSLREAGATNINFSTDGAANLGMQIAAANKGWSLLETAAPSGAANRDVCYGDSTLHALKCSYNNGTFFQVPQVITATSSAFATATTAGTCVQNVTAVTGAATTMTVNVSPVSTPGVGAQWSAFVSSAGNVTINECAVATSAGGTIAFNIRVFP